MATLLVAALIAIISFVTYSCVLQLSTWTELHAYVRHTADEHNNK
jgi:hypothetical protein